MASEPAEPMRRLLAAGVAETAVRRYLCEECLMSEIERRGLTHGGERLAAWVGVTWREFAEWLPDTSRVPAYARERLSRRLHVPPDTLVAQDWEGAEAHAARMQQLRPDMAWPYAVLGRAAERRRDIPAAIGWYWAGLWAPAASQAFTEGWAPFETGGRKSFSAYRLARLADDLPAELWAHPYLAAALDSRSYEPPLYTAARAYWVRRAEEAERAGAFEEAYRCYYSAGWDDGFSNDIEQFLAHLVRTAEAMGSRTLAAIARAHIEERRTWAGP